jgi:FtsP/CotA-like multicopper oxidase with cupredoxin domain
MANRLSLLLAMLLISLATESSFAKTVRYELNVTKTNINLSGKKTVDFALMVNGTIPAPTLEFTEGDDAEIIVNNKLEKEEVSTHWHGILLPPEMDGVAYVNTPPIFPGKSHTFRFKIRQHGTYWYHSHTMVQEQKGIYGAFIIHPKKETIHADKEVVAVLSDWSDENADNIIRNLRKDGEYYRFKKGTVRSWAGAIHAGKFGTLLSGEWSRMGGMDLSDVGYDAFLINGKRDSQLLTAHPGEKIRLRVINAAASSYFYISLGQRPMKIISADGVDIEPVFAKEALMAMAETLDVLFEVPEHKNFEFRATSQDVTGFASGWIGMGEKVTAVDKPFPDLYAGMDHAGHDRSGQKTPETVDHSKMDHGDMDHSTMDHSAHESAKQDKTGPVAESLTVDEIRAKEKTTLPVRAPRFDLKLVLGGDMERYIWHINGEAIHQDRTITINEGDVVRFTFENETMMHHPMHLHGHFFRVLNKFGEWSPLKHTIDVPPHASRTIEFYANEPGEWMLHCHNLYHMKTGMARVVKYSSYKPKPEIEGHQNHDPHLHDHLYHDGSVRLATNLGEARFRLSKTWDTLEARVETRKDEEWDVDGDLFYRRWFGQYLNFILGADSFHRERRGLIGVGYLLPMLIETNLLVDGRGRWRLDLEKQFQWTKYISSGVELKQRQWEEPEWTISLFYRDRWSWGAGLMFTGKTVGAGFDYRF